MSRFQPERRLLGCTGEGAVLLALPTTTGTSGRERLGAVRIEAPAQASAAALADALPTLAPAPAPRAAGAPAVSLAVTLADALVRSFIVTPPIGAHGLRELRACAAARFTTLYGESAEAWLLAADWQAAAPFIACAMPRALHRAIEELAARQRWRLASLRPALVRVWNHLSASIPRDGWLLVGFGQTLSLLHTRHGQVAGLRNLHLSDAPTLPELEILLDQERLRIPVEGDPRARQSLLWAGAAAWLPATGTVGGLASRLVRLPAAEITNAELPEAEQLALAGSEP